jgi:hypothetical protein
VCGPDPLKNGDVAKSLICQITTRIKNVGFITLENVIWISIYDIFMLKLYYKQNPTTERQDPNDTRRIHLPDW